MSTCARLITRSVAVGSRQYSAHFQEGCSAPLCCRQPHRRGTLRTGNNHSGEGLCLADQRRVWSSQQSSGLMRGLSQMPVATESLGKCCSFFPNIYVPFFMANRPQKHSFVLAAMLPVFVGESCLVKTRYDSCCPPLPPTGLQVGNVIQLWPMRCKVKEEAC